MTSVQNLRPLLNGSKSLFGLFVIILLLSSCAWFKKAEDGRNPRNNNDELEEIEGKRVYNPETGKYEYETEVTEKMDTVQWTTTPPDLDPPITSEDDNTTTGNNNTTTNPDLPIYDPSGNVNSPKMDSYNIAVLLPFLTNQFDPTSSSVPNNSSWAINYYAGAKMAMDRLNQENIRLNINVLDTKASESEIPYLLEKGELLNADMIIGPYRSVNVKQVAAFAKQYKKPLVSPYTASLSVTEDNPFYIQVNPSLKTHAEAITKHLRKRYSPEDVVILARNNGGERAAIKYFQDANYAYEGSTNAERFQEKIFTDDSADAINDEDFTLLIKPNKTTVFVIPCYASESFVSNVLRKINVSKGYNNVVVYGLPQWMNFNRISADYFERLNVHVSSSNFTDSQASNIRFFKQDFYNKYGTIPTEEAFLGYDTVLYFGRMIHKYGTRFQYLIDQEEVESLHTTFAFEPVMDATTTGGEDFTKVERFENKFVNILKFENYRFMLDK